MTQEKPIESKELESRRGMQLSTRKSSATAIIKEITLPPGSELCIARDKRHPDSFKLKCPVDQEGLPPRVRREVKGIQLDKEMIAPFRDVQEIDGMVPDGSKIAFLPSEAKRERVQEHLDATRVEDDDGKKREKGEDRDRGGTIFGTDDRYLFNDRSFPWRTTGLVRTAAGRCSGTMIGPRHVLTASHCINWTSGGGAGWITFTPGFFDGDEPWGEFAAVQVAYWLQAPGSLTDQQTAFDYAVLILEQSIGDVIGYPGYRTYDDDWNGGTFWQYVGYPGELAGGQRPAFQNDCVISSAQSQSLSGNSALVLGHFNEFTPGQSGGAVWGWWGSEPWPRVVGVGSTIGSTAVQTPTGSTTGDNEYGGGSALSSLITWSRANF